MEWQFPVTEKSLIAIQKQAVLSFAEKKPSQKSFFLSPPLAILLLIAAFILLYQLKGRASLSLEPGQAAFLSRSILAVCVLLLLFFFFRSRRARSASSENHSGKTGFCKCRVEGDWFYFLRSVPGKETTFCQKPLREITRIYARNGGLLLVFSNVTLEFLPPEAFRSHTLSESQQYLQEQCLAALRRPETDSPLPDPFPGLLPAPQEPLLSCSFAIPGADAASIYLSCMRDWILRPCYYWENKKIYLPAALLTPLFLIIFFRTHVLMSLAAALILPISIPLTLLILKRNVIKQSQDGGLRYLSEPQRISLYPDYLAFYTASSVKRLPYSRFYGVYQTQVSYYLATRKPGSLFFLPRKAFPAVSEEEAFIRCLREKIKEAGK